MGRGREPEFPVGKGVGAWEGLHADVGHHKLAGLLVLPCVYVCVQVHVGMCGLCLSLP